MKQFLVLITLCLLANTIKAQEPTVKYYKDAALTEICSKSDAKFRQTTYEHAEHIDSIKVENVIGQSLLWDKYFVNGQPRGVWHTYNEQGKLEIERDFNAILYSFTPIDSLVENLQKQNTNYTLPEFEGGEDALFKFLAQNINYPKEAKAEGVSGTVYIRFLIDENGKTKAHSIMRGVNPYLDYEAWRVVNSLPDWKPAMNDGQAVRAVFNLPIRFALK